MHAKCSSSSAIFILFAVISTSANEFVVGFMRNYVKPSNYRYSLLRLNNTYLFVTTADPEGAVVTITFDGTETVHAISPPNAGSVSAATLQLPTGTRVQGDWDRNKGKVCNWGGLSEPHAQ